MKCSQIKCPFQRDITEECNLDDCPYRTESVEPQDIVTEIADGIVAQIRESEDEFIYTMVSPFCETVVEKNLSKKELERILRRGMEQESVLDKVRFEIEDTGAYEQEVHGKTEFLKGIDYCLSVINRYRAKEE